MKNSKQDSSSSNELEVDEDRKEVFDLIWKNKNNYYEHLATSLPNPCIRMQKKPGYFLCLGHNPRTNEGQAMTFYNQVHFDPAYPTSKSDLDEINKLAKETGVQVIAGIPYYAKDMDTRLDDLFDKGYLQLGTGPGMVSDFDTKDIEWKDDRSDLKIGELIKSTDVENEDEDHNVLLRHWCRVLVTSFGFASKEKAIDYFYDVFKNTKFGPKEPLRLFYVIHRDTPESSPRMISVASLFIEKDIDTGSSNSGRKGVAGLYNVATLPDPTLRRKGAARYLSTYMVYKIAKNDLNLRYCTLQSSKAAYNLYKQLGFETIGHWVMTVYPDPAHWLVALLLKITFLRLLMRLLGIRDLSQRSSWIKLLIVVLIWIVIMACSFMLI